MRKIRQFADRNEQQQEAPEQQGSSLACCAGNCPLTGTISTSTRGGNWRCWAHDRLEEASQWPYLTNGINQNLWLFRLAEKIVTMPGYDMEKLKAKEIESYLKSRGHAELCRQKNTGQFPERCEFEPRSAWATRLRNAAYAAAFSYVADNWSRAA